jgi:predicted nucleotidyltransferase
MTHNFNIAEAMENLRLTQCERDADLQKRYARALADFQAITVMLITRYNPARIYQWGSLLNPTDFSEISDIDIAVEGIPDAQTFFKLYGDAWDCTDLPLDLVEIDKIDPLHAESIRKKGKLIYERK